MVGVLPRLAAEELTRSLQPNSQDLYLVVMAVLAKVLHLERRVGELRPGRAAAWA